MKKILSFLLTFVMLLSLCSVTAFATDESLAEEKCELLDYIDDAEYNFVQYLQLTPPTIVMFSESSRLSLETAINQVRSEIDSYTTIEEINDAYTYVNSYIDQLQINESELKFMLDLMKPDYEDTTYYDAETSAEIKEIYEAAQSAYESKTPQSINDSYIALRNELNKLCMSVTVVGDVNNDGVFSIRDVTLIQKYLAGSVQLTSAQCFSCNLNKYRDISLATEYQKALCDPSDIQDFDVYINTKYTMSRLNTYCRVLTTDFRNDGPLVGYCESCNSFYYINRYYNICGPNK